MLRKILHFIQYNNAFSIAFSVIFLGTSATFAASEDLRDAVLDSQEVVRSVDNGFIISTNLDSFDFNLQIQDVAEDDLVYNVTYTYRTIAVDDYAWKIVDKEEVLKVSKVALSSSYLNDLGLYVAKNVGDNIKAELEYLKKVQKRETESGLSSKVIATEYSGLIGKHFDIREKSFSGYSAVVSPLTKEEAREKLSPDEISGQTMAVLLQRREKQKQEDARLAEEKKRAEESIAATLKAILPTPAEKTPSKESLIGNVTVETSTADESGNEDFIPDVITENNTPTPIPPTTTPVVINPEASVSTTTPVVTETNTSTSTTTSETTNTTTSTSTPDNVTEASEPVSPEETPVEPLPTEETTTEPTPEPPLAPSGVEEEPTPEVTPETP